MLVPKRESGHNGGGLTVQDESQRKDQKKTVHFTHILQR